MRLYKSPIMIDAIVGDGHDFEPEPSLQLLEYQWQEGTFDMINQLPARAPSLVLDCGNLNGTTQLAEVF